MSGTRLRAACTSQRARSRARRLQERRVVEAGGARIVRRRVGRGLQLEQGHAAGAEPRGLAVAVDDAAGRSRRCRNRSGASRSRAFRPTAPMRSGVVFAKVGEAEGLGASMAAAFLCRSLYWGAWRRDNRARGGGGRKDARAGVQAGPAPVGAGWRGADSSANPYLEQIEARMSVDAATVRRIAHLARIAVADDEVEHLQGELNAMLAFVEQLSGGERRGRRADDLGDADGDEEARGRGHRRRHRGRHRAQCAGDRGPLFPRARRWWSSHVLGLSGRRARAHLVADRHHFAREDAGRAHGRGPARHGPAAAGRALPRGAAGRHDPDPAGRAVRAREEEDRTEEQLRLRQPGPNDRPDLADARARRATACARKTSPPPS